MSGPPKIYTIICRKSNLCKALNDNEHGIPTTRQCIYAPIYGQSYISLNHCENGYLGKTTIFLNQFPQTRHQLIKIKPLWIFETTRIR